MNLRTCGAGLGLPVLLCQLVLAQAPVVTDTKTGTESLRQQEVEAALGQPNRTCGAGDHGFWYHCAANGTKLQVRFMGDGLGDASYIDVGASIESELNGRNIYKVLQERAAKSVVKASAVFSGVAVGATVR